jgi:hypothetical protein
VIVVDDTDDPDRLTIDGVPENATVAEGGNLSALGIDVRNAGGLEGEGTLALNVDDGNLTTTRELTLSSNQSRTVGFPSATIRLDPGEYPFNVTLDGDQRNGTLIVAENPARTTIDDDDVDDGGGNTSGSENSSSTEDDNENPTSTDENTTDTDTDTNPTDAGENSTASDSAGAANSDRNSSDPADDSGGQDGEIEPAIFPPFGIGTRETFVGTILVGAIHILGHWV